MTFHPDDLPDLKGKVFVVTGGNSGIGYYTVAHLAEHGAHVYMGARSLDKATKAIADIKNAYPSAVNIDVLQMDLMDFGSVVAAAKRLIAHETELHGLVNNAGIMATPFEISKNGYEAQWQTNYLSHWLFTEHLLPLMQQTAKTLPRGSVRIVNVSSAGHLGAPTCGIDFDDLSLENGSPWTRYSQSKLANILHTKILDKNHGPGPSSSSSSSSSSTKNPRPGEIWVSSIHPGLVETNIATSASQSGLAVSMLFPLFRFFGMMSSADKGCYTSLWAVAGPDFSAYQSGGYYEIFKRFGEPKNESALAKDLNLAEKLDNWSRKTMKQEGWLLE